MKQMTLPARPKSLEQTNAFAKIQNNAIYIGLSPRPKPGTYHCTLFMPLIKQSLERIEWVVNNARGGWATEINDFRHGLSRPSLLLLYQVGHLQQPGLESQEGHGPKKGDHSGYASHGSAGHGPAAHNGDNEHAWFQQILRHRPELTVLRRLDNYGILTQPPDPASQAIMLSINQATMTDYLAGSDLSTPPADASLPPTMLRIAQALRILEASHIVTIEGDLDRSVMRAMAAAEQLEPLAKRDDFATAVL